MNSMQEAMVRAGIVTEKRAKRVERDKEVSKVLHEERNGNRDLRDARKAMESLIARSRNMAFQDIASSLTSIQKKYPSVFDQVAVEFTYRLNMPDLTRSIKLPS